MAKDNLKGSHLSPVPDAAGSHRMSKTVQRDIRQAEPIHQGTVGSIEAGRRYAVDVTGELASTAKPGHQWHRHRHRSNAGL